MRTKFLVITLMLAAALRAQGRVGEPLEAFVNRYGEARKDTEAVRLPGHDQFYFDDANLAIECVVSGNRCIMEVFHTRGHRINDEDLSNLMKADGEGLEWAYDDQTKIWTRRDGKLRAYRAPDHPALFYIEDIAAVKEARPPGAGADSATAAAKKTDPGWQSYIWQDLRTMVKDLLYASKFEELDAMVAEINEKQSRFTDGGWKLDLFFKTVSHPVDAGDWKALFRQLEEWDKHSRSAFSKSAVGHAQMSYAWSIRTGAAAQDVSPEQMQAFGVGVEKAMQTLSAALQMSPKCVDTYAQVLKGGQALGWDREKMNATLSAAIAVVPDYYPCFDTVAYYNMERWYGKSGDEKEFLQSILKLVPGDRGYQTYAYVAVILQPYYKEDLLRSDGTGIADWPTMKQGFEVLLRDYPVAWNRNLYAAFACLAKDRATARAQYDELVAAKHIMTGAWFAAGGFPAAKKWILETP